MVFPLPVADIVTVLPLIGLLLASLSVMVKVMAEMPSARAEVGEATIVEVLVDTAPAVNVTVAVLVRVMLSVASVADMVLASALVDLRVAVV